MPREPASAGPGERGAAGAGRAAAHRSRLRRALAAAQRGGGWRWEVSNRRWREERGERAGVSGNGYQDMAAGGRSSHAPREPRG